MKATAIGIEEKVDALLVCLDKDIQHLQEGLSQLDELRRLVIKRDEIALGRLLEKIQKEADDYRHHERMRQSIRQELAAALEYDLKQTTLSALETILPQGKKDQITERKKKIKPLIEEFRKEHTGVTLLLSECARFNKMLLMCIFDLSKAENICYNANGAAKRQNDISLINLKL